MRVNARAIATTEPIRRGYHVSYRQHEHNHCPGCGRSHWWVGRLMAECGFCATAIPIEAAGMTGSGLVRRAAQAQPQ